MSQENEFKPFFVKDANSGNITIYYAIDSVRSYNTLFVPRTKIQPQILVNVSPQDSVLSYNYKIINSNARQRILGFEKESNSNNVVTELPIGWFSRSTSLNNFVQFVYKNRQGHSIPIDGVFDFNQFGRGLPEPIEFRVYGKIDTVDLIFEIEPSEESNLLIDSIVNSESNKYVVIYSIGPTEKTMSLNPLGMLDSISKYVSESFTLKWIKNENIKNKYLYLLTASKTQLSLNNLTSYQQYLTLILSDINSDSSSSITSEAYALIRYNVEYLLSKVPQSTPGAIIKLINSNGNVLAGGLLQYYDGSWKNAVNNNNGTFSIATTKTSLSLRMSYGFASQTKNNVPIGSDTIIFQTVNTAVRLLSSTGQFLDTGTVQYYAGAWRSFGSTVNGIVRNELLPGTYSFRMSYGFASKDTMQDIAVNSMVTFVTTNATVQLKNSVNTSLDQGIVQYYAGAWRPFGMTVNGSISKELLPNSYSFRMTYEYAGNDKVQHIGSDPVVQFQTVRAQVKLLNSHNAAIDQGTVQYYAGAWRSFGSTSNGIVEKELLPNSVQFRLTHEYISNDKTQNIGSDRTVVFQTVPVSVLVKNLLNAPVTNAAVSYYAGAWRSIGSTAASGQITKELLPANVQFRAKSGTIQQDKTQNTGANPLVEIQLNIAQ